MCAELSRVKSVTPVLAGNAGMASELEQLVICEVDLDALTNRHPMPSLEDTELLSVVTLGACVISFRVCIRMHIYVCET